MSDQTGVEVKPVNTEVTQPIQGENGDNPKKENEIEYKKRVIVVTAFRPGHVMLSASIEGRAPVTKEIPKEVMDFFAGNQELLSLIELSDQSPVHIKKPPVVNKPVVSSSATNVKPKTKPTELKPVEPISLEKTTQKPAETSTAGVTKPGDGQLSMF